MICKDPFQLESFYDSVILSFIKGICQQRCLLSIDVRDDLCLYVYLVPAAICVFHVSMSAVGSVMSSGTQQWREGHEAHGQGDIVFPQKE